MPMWLTKALNETFPCDGYDPIDCSFNLRAMNYLGGKRITHRSRPSTQIRAFFGLPSSLRSDEDSVAFSILKDFFYWPEDPNASTLRKVIGVFHGIVFLPFRLVLAVGSTLIHTLMLLTELLPLALRNLCKEKFGEDSIGARIFYWAHFVGRAITSPYNNLRAQIKEGSTWKISLTATISASVLILLGIPAFAIGILPLYIGLGITQAASEFFGLNFQEYGERSADDWTRSIHDSLKWIRSKWNNLFSNNADLNQQQYMGPATIARPLGVTTNPDANTNSADIRADARNSLDEETPLLDDPTHPPSEPSSDAEEDATADLSASSFGTAESAEEIQEEDKPAAPSLTG